MPTGTTPTPSARLHHQQTIAAIADQWCPYDVTLAKDLYAELHAGDYGRDRERLLQKLGQDLGLYGFYVKEIAKRRYATQQPINQGETPSFRNPRALIATSSMDDLCAVAKAATTGSPIHALDRASSEQLAHLQRMIVSASAAELAAAPQQLDPSVAHTSALFRQLGMFLIAWNYPNVFRRAIRVSDPEVSLDRRLSRLLGFSPTLLAVTLARDWGMHDEFLCVLGGDGAAQTSAVAPDSTAAALIQLCRIGEALAVASDPSVRHLSPSGWATARAEFEHIVGPHAMALLSEKAARYTKHYAAACPPGFALPAHLQQLQSEETVSSGDRLCKNRFVSKCPQATQILFTNFYADLNPSLISKNKIDYLTERVSPSLGFESICIFLVDGESQMLIPRLTAGARKKTSYTEISYLPNEHHAIAQAFRSDRPITGPLQGRGNLSFIAAPLGEAQRMGVIYIELDNKHLQNRHENPLTYFRALHQALRDCFNLA